MTRALILSLLLVTHTACNQAPTGPDLGVADDIRRTEAAAITIYSGIFDVPASMVPSLDDNVSSSNLQVLRNAAEASIAKWHAPVVE